jgi:hypothetical protein
MVTYIKTRTVHEEEDSENKSNLPHPSTSKAEKEMTDKKIRLYDNSYSAMGFTMTGDENYLLPSCTVCAKKYIKYGYCPGKVKFAPHK